MIKRVKGEKAEILAVYDGDKLVGMVCIVKSTNLIYIQYIAIVEECQSKGYGSGILTAMKERYGGKPIILEVEEMNSAAPNYEQRVRRKAFYERNGFTMPGIMLEELGIKYGHFFAMVGTLT